MLAVYCVECVDPLLGYSADQGPAFPGVSRVSTDLLREGAPIEPDPPVSHWKPEAVVKMPSLVPLD